MSKRSVIRIIDRTEYDERFCRNGGAYAYYSDYIFEGGVWWVNHDSSCEMTSETGWFPWTDAIDTVKKVIRDARAKANDGQDFEIFVTKEFPPSATLDDYVNEIRRWKEERE